MLRKLLSTPTAQLGKAGRFAIFQIKLWSHCARLLRKNRAGLQAAALSYNTIFGLVPLAIVMLLIFQLFPASSQIGDKVKNVIYRELHFANFSSDADAQDAEETTALAQDAEETTALAQDAEETIALTEHIDKLVNSFFTGTHKGTITIFSVLLVIWAARSLLSTIERAFNRIWHVSRGRNFLQRTINYWALLTLGPLLLGFGIYITTKVAIVGRLQGFVLAHIAPAFLSYIVATGVFFLLYFVLPNTKVQAKDAIWGAAVAALVWIAAKNFFGYTVTELKLYNTVYGVMAMIPITVMWIYITWWIVLFGLQLTFTTQHLKSLDAAEIAAAEKTEDHFIANDFTIINIVKEIATAFEANNAPVSPEVICTKMNMPAEFGDQILNHLVANGILIKSSEPAVGFIPAQNPANIKLSEISDVVAKAGLGRQTGLEQITQAHRKSLDQYNLKQIIDSQTSQNSITQ